MSESRHDQIGEHFLNARELLADARRQYLDAIKAADPDLASEVESLLRADEQELAVLDETDAGGFSKRLHTGAGDDLVGQTLGRYTIVRVIASGGMGTVYEATQEKPRRTVAVKVMKRGLASPSALRRFEVEAQILGQLQHPGIAQVFEANVHEGEGGRIPYFVMEYIPDALTVTEYAKRNNLTLPARLELFARVCDAVHHGHQKGVIHRDLKPGNVLVDATGQPKIIDFGVARATDIDVQITTMQTDVGQLIGTLAYMSPEQVTGNPQAIDTRSDVYGLGVVLYELLSGRMPQDLTNRSLIEAARIIQETDPSRLSAISTAYRGDVETIVAKAMEKDKERRYQSAAELAGDIRRFLGNQPIMARPASTTYQLKKFAKRNKGLVAAGAVALLFLIVGLIATTWYAYRASHERDVAIEAKRKMQLETDKANAINDFLINDLLSAADPVQGIGHDVTIVRALEESEEKIGKAFKSQPEVEVSVRQTIGNVAMRIGRLDQAEDEFRRALALLEAAPQVDEQEVARTKERLAFTLRKRGQIKEAIQLFEELVDFWHGRADENPTKLADALHGLSSTVYVDETEGHLERAESIIREALAIYEEKLGPEHPSTLDSLGQLSNALYSQGKIEESLAIHNRILEIQIKQHGRDHYDVARYKYDLAVINMKIKNYHAADTLLTECEETMRKAAGEANPIVAKALGQHGRLYAKQGDHHKAEPYYVEALRIQHEHLDPNHEDLAWTLTYLARTRMALEKFSAAEPIWQEAYESAKATEGETSMRAAIRLFDWGTCQVSQSKYKEAEPKLRTAMKLFEGIFEPDSIMINRARVQLAICLTHKQAFDEAEQLLSDAYNSVSSAEAPDPELLKLVIDAYVKLFEESKHPEDAAIWKAKRDATGA